MKTRSPWVQRLKVSRGERRALTELLPAGRTGLWLAVRARAVLLGAEGWAVSEIARRVGRDRKWVRQWLARFARDRLAGLRDASRSGRPPKVSPRRAA
jgi:hypothetical protein